MNHVQALRDQSAKIVTGALLVTSGLSAFAVDPATPLEAITSAKDAVLPIVAAGGLAMILVSLAFVGWRVGAKFVSRIGSKG